VRLVGSPPERSRLPEPRPARKRSAQTVRRSSGIRSFEISVSTSFFVNTAPERQVGSCRSSSVARRVLALGIGRTVSFGRTVDAAESRRGSTVSTAFSPHFVARARYGATGDWRGPYPYAITACHPSHPNLGAVRRARPWPPPYARPMASRGDEFNFPRIRAGGDAPAPFAVRSPSRGAKRHDRSVQKSDRSCRLSTLFRF
jgi:hypothetical protein